MNTSKSLDQILIDFLKEDDDGNVNLTKARQAIVEAVEGLIKKAEEDGEVFWGNGQERLLQAIKEWQ